MCLIDVWRAGLCGIPFFSLSLAGDEQWNGQCRNGRKQSPIDLARDASVIGKYKPLYFKNYDNVISNATVRNTGHSCK